MNVTTPDGLFVKAKEYFQEVFSLVSKRRHLANLLNFFVGMQFIYPMIITFFVFVIFPINKNTPIIITFLSNLTGTIVAIYLMWSDIVDGLRVFKENVKGNIILIFKHFGLILLGNFVLSLIILFLTGELTPSNNQDQINEIFKFDPKLMTIIIIGFAPITEELLFRNTIFRKAYERYGLKRALFFSSFIFGFMHVLISFLSSDFADLINVFIYIHMGIQMGLLYFKSGTIVTPMLLHFLNNLLSLFSLLELF